MDHARAESVPAQGDDRLRAAFGFDLDCDSWLARVRDSDRAPILGRLGPYELLSEIGRGAQGVVYKARQPRTGREVALKRAAAGVFSSASMRARFEREVEAAVALSHPNIVTLYGSELIDDQPVLTMQWVDGEAFDRWAARAARPVLDVPRLLGTFVTICDAIHHAHQRGVIHRDIKPSNILVDAQDRPFVLDFGLAKLTSGAAEAASVTYTGDFVGTPAYAAPEQVRGDLLAIDVRTDVYALGVLLYQALSRRLPFEEVTPLSRLLECIQHDDPSPPSRIQPLLGRELDAIVLKALAKRNEERYQSVAALADDVRRYLAGQTVHAHPPTWSYRTRKYVRRHWLGVTSMLAFVALLLAATAVSTTFYLQARDALTSEQHEHERAEAALVAEREQRARVEKEQARAQRETEKTAAVNKFVGDMLRHADATQQRGRANITIREALDAASARLISGAVKYDPEVEADLRMMVGEVYLRLTVYEPAKAQLAAALELRKQIFGADSETVGTTLNYLARAYRGQGLYAEAEQMLRESLALRRRLLGPDSLYVAQALCSLAVTLRLQGKYVEADALYREALAIYEAKLGPDDENVGVVSSARGVVLTFLDRLDEADASLQRAITIHEKHGGDANLSDAATARFNLAAVRWKQGRQAEAEQLARESIDTVRRLRGDPHAATANEEQILAGWLAEAQRWDEAEAPYRSALQAQEKLLGDAHVATIVSLQGLATVLQHLQRLPEAEYFGRRALAAQERIDPGHPHGALLGGRLAESILRQGRFEEAEALLCAAWDRLVAANDQERMRIIARHYVEYWKARDAAEPDAGHTATAFWWTKQVTDLESAELR